MKKKIAYVLGVGLLLANMVLATEIEPTLESMAANMDSDFTVNGTLSLQLGERGFDRIYVVGAFTIDSSTARLAVDLSYYVGGPRSVELVHFSSHSGSFDPNNISIRGLHPGQTASITYDSDSMDLLITAQPQSASMFWFSQKAWSGTRSGGADDLFLNNGRFLADLDMPGLSCKRTGDGDDLLYSITWAGNDFDGDSINDVISFDLRVEGFHGSTFTYNTEAGASSMTALGGSSDVTDIGNTWGVGGDLDLDEGQSLRFSVTNPRVSTPGYVAEFEGFTGMGASESDGGREHRFVLGEGTGLDSEEFSIPEQFFTFAAVDRFVVTGAGSFYETSQWAVSRIDLQLRVYNPTHPSDWDPTDYSEFVTGPTYWDEYPAQKSFVNYPAFSWDRVPRWLIVRKSTAYTDTEINSMATNYEVIVWEKANQAGFDTIEEGILNTAARIRAVYPATKNIFYWNSWINYFGYAANTVYDENAWDWSDHNTDSNGLKVIDLFKDLYYTHNYSVPGMRDWWVNTALGMASNPVIDGVFIDKVTQSPPSMVIDGEPASDLISMYLALRQGLPAGKLLLGNTLRNERPNGNRAHMEIQDGSYLERWTVPNRDSRPSQSEADATAVSIQLMREALAKGKIILFKTSGPDSSIEDFQAAVDFPLALFLIVAEPNAYFAYQASVDARDETWQWDASGVEEFNRPLGPPLGAPVKNGTVYTRSYEHVDVWVDLSAKAAVLLWHDAE